jgi:hypothetical protein
MKMYTTTKPDDIPTNDCSWFGYLFRVCCGLSINVRIAYFFSMCVAFGGSIREGKTKDDHFI